MTDEKKEKKARHMGHGYTEQQQKKLDRIKELVSKLPGMKQTIAALQRQVQLAEHEIAVHESDEDLTAATSHVELRRLMCKTKSRDVTDDEFNSFLDILERDDFVVIESE